MIRARIFDMDGTLIRGDTDVSWQEFLIDNRLAPPEARAENERFYQRYLAGTLVPEGFLEFQFRVVIGRTEEEFRALAQRHFEERIRPMILRAARQYLDECRSAGERVALLSSTEATLVAPAAHELGIDEIIGTRLSVENGRVSGRLAGPYGLGAGKLECAAAWLREIGADWSEIAYYGDSYNDRYMLEKVGFPFAVNPDNRLRALAETRNWPILNWNLQA